MISGILTIFLLFFSIQAHANENVYENYINQNQVIEKEIKLSRNPVIYFVFDMPENKIYIKSRGINLKEINIQKSGYWGSPIAVSTLKVKNKSTLIKPERETISPGSNNKDSFELDALELTDMPSRYKIVFESGVTVFIRPLQDGFFSAIGNAFYESSKFLVRPVSMILKTLKGAPLTTFDIVLNENDARAIYWSLSENSEVIVNM